MVEILPSPKFQSHETGLLDVISVNCTFDPYGGLISEIVKLAIGGFPDGTKEDQVAL